MKVERTTGEAITNLPIGPAQIVPGKRYVIAGLHPVCSVARHRLDIGREVIITTRKSATSSQYPKAVDVKTGEVMPVFTYDTFITPPRHLPQPEQLVQITMPLDAAKEFFAEAYYRAESDSSAEKLADEIDEALKVL